MTEYLIGLRGSVNTSSGLAGHGAEPPHDALPGSDRPADYENCVVASNCAEDVRPGLAIERGGNGLSTTGNSPKDKHLANAVDAQEELGQQGVQCRPALLYATVGDRVACAFRGGNSGQPELAEIPGQRSLGHVPSALEKQLPKIFLAAHDP